MGLTKQMDQTLEDILPSLRDLVVQNNVQRMESMTETRSSTDDENETDASGNYRYWVDLPRSREETAKICFLNTPLDPIKIIEEGKVDMKMSIHRPVCLIVTRIGTPPYAKDRTTLMFHEHQEAFASVLEHLYEEILGGARGEPLHANRGIRLSPKDDFEHAMKMFTISVKYGLNNLQGTIINQLPVNIDAIVLVREVSQVYSSINELHLCVPKSLRKWFKKAVLNALRSAHTEIEDPWGTTTEEREQSVVKLQDQIKALAEQNDDVALDFKEALLDDFCGVINKQQRLMEMMYLMAKDAKNKSQESLTVKSENTVSGNALVVTRKPSRLGLSRGWCPVPARHVW